ncbi:MAG: hypothetical protein ACRDYU_04475 [Actinomycetes bacterium]
MADDDLTNLLMPGTTATPAAASTPLMGGLTGMITSLTQSMQVLGAMSELSGDDIAMSPDDIEDLAKRLFGALTTLVQHEHAEFLGAPREWAIFGGMPEAQQFSSQLSAAHDVVAETVVGLRQDLEGFQEQLMASVRTALSADEGAESALLRFATHLDDSYAMASHQVAASEEHSAVLGDGDTGARIVSGDPTASEPPTSAAAPSSTTPSDSGTGDTSTSFE